VNLQPERSQERLPLLVGNRIVRYLALVLNDKYVMVNQIAFEGDLMGNLKLYDTGAPVIAKTYMAPLGNRTIVPGMKGVILTRQEWDRRHQVQFENGRVVWATSDQIKLDPSYVPKVLLQPEPETESKPETKAATPPVAKPASVEPKQAVPAVSRPVESQPALGEKKQPQPVAESKLAEETKPASDAQPAPEIKPAATVPPISEMKPPAGSQSISKPGEQIEALAEAKPHSGDPVAAKSDEKPVVESAVTVPPKVPTQEEKVSEAEAAKSSSETLVSASTPQEAQAVAPGTVQAAGPAQPAGKPGETKAAVSTAPVPAGKGDPESVPNKAVQKQASVPAAKRKSASAQKNAAKRQRRKNKKR